MVWDLIRDAPFGQLLRYITNNRILQYPEEKSNFRCPDTYVRPEGTSQEKGRRRTSKVSTRSSAADRNSLQNESVPRLVEDPDQGRVQTLPRTQESHEVDVVLGLYKTQSRLNATDPPNTEDGIILVDWYTTDDPENPQNWSQSKKAWTMFLIFIYTFVVYASSCIYVSSTELIMQRFGVGHFEVSLGLALYVLGYGTGPLIFAPMSEVPHFGRNIPYITTFAIFTILTLPASVVDNFKGLLVLRFLLGFFGSPCLANGGASVGDMYSPLYLPYPLAVWVSAAFAAPALGPLLSGFSVYAKDWRWSQWEMLWMAAPVLILFLFFLPETQPTTILHHRAARLRTLTGNLNVRTRIEVTSKALSSMLVEALIKPIEITIKDPAVLFVNIYTAIMYGTYYSFFEVFPLVYPIEYGFNVGETAIVFTCIVVGCLIAIPIHFAYLHWYLIPDIRKNGFRAQEHRLVPAIFATFCLPIGLLIFGWTATASIHWMVSIVGQVIFAVGCFILLQCIYTYVPMSYPQYAASLFAANDLFRASFAFGSILFSRSMYINLGVAEGVTLLAGLSVIGILGIIVLWYKGAELMAKSSFAI